MEMTVPAVPAGRWFAWRNKLLASKAFQRRAAAFFLTRPIARRRARAVFDLVAGFVYSQVLVACVRLRLFDMLAEGPRTLAEIAERLDLPQSAAQRLLFAAVSLQLVERRGAEHFGLGVLGAPLAGNGAVAAMVEHHTAFYADLADPVALLRREGMAHAANAGAPNRLASYWPYAGALSPRGLEPGEVSEYSALMSASQPLVAEEILAAYPFSRHRRVLDIGGGEGTFLVRAAAHAPHLELVLFDLPAVADRARARFEAAGLSARASAFGGDFLQDELPGGADLATLVRVVHDHDDAAAMTILEAAQRALHPGGTLLLAEPMAGTDGAEPMGDAYFGFYLMAMGRGKPRSSERLESMLRKAGFDDVRLLHNPLPMQTRILTAKVGVN